MAKQQRQSRILQLLRNQELTSSEITDKLNADGFKISRKTITRDLDELSCEHGVCSDGQFPEHFFLSQDYTPKHQMEFNEKTLQVLMMALENLKVSSNGYLEEKAQEVKQAILSKLEAKTAEHIENLMKDFHADFSASGKAQGNTQELDLILEALRNKQSFHCNNHSPYKDEKYNKRKRHFAPYRFILSSNIPYLLVEDLEDQQFKKLLITRIKNVELNQSFNPKKLEDHFDLDAMIGGFGGKTEDLIEIQVTGDEVFGTFFLEKKIHHSQIIERLDQNQYRLSLRAPQSFELVRRLASFGGHIKSITPSSLDQQVSAVWKSGLKKAV